MSHLHLAPVLSTLAAPTNLRDQVSHSLRVSITSGELEPGRVYSVPALAATFGTSATPVREAMLGLARERLVEVVPNKGFRILEVSLGELAQIDEVRMLLEPPAVASLAGHLSSLQLEGLRSHVDLILNHAHEGDVEGAADAAFAFRDTLLSQCPNNQLVDTIRTLRARARAGYPKTSINWVRFAASQYGLIEALARGDREKILRVVGYEVSRFGPGLRQVASQA